MGDKQWSPVSKSRAPKTVAGFSVTPNALHVSADKTETLVSVWILPHYVRIAEAGFPPTNRWWMVVLATWWTIRKQRLAVGCSLAVLSWHDIIHNLPNGFIWEIHESPGPNIPPDSLKKMNEWIQTKACICSLVTNHYVEDNDTHKQTHTKIVPK